LKVKPWLQLFRAQTAPATLLCILVPYLHNASFFDLRTLLLAVSTVLFHYFSFGANSLMDTAMGYDQKDSGKQHHPLISGAIELHKAHNVIHWGLAVLTAWATALTLWISPNPATAMAALILWVAFGHAYNDGLSKESLFGFISISICCTASSAWGWFLSHGSLDNLGALYLTYVFFTILFQISWSGFIKEIGIRERSNILSRMGAHLDVTWKGEREFKPGKAVFYGVSVKGFNLFLGGLLLWFSIGPPRLECFQGNLDDVLPTCVVAGILVTLVNRVILCSFYIFFVGLALLYLHKLTKTRIYNRGKELLNMSLLEISTIYLPIPLMLGILEASILMVIGVLYFFTVNLMLWGKLYPRV